MIAAAFAELGYRRTTTAELARRCGVQETILYRLWKDKRAMFIAAIEHVYEVSERAWRHAVEVEAAAARSADGRDARGARGAHAARPARRTSAERMLAYESRHIGEFGYARILFAGLGETDDPQIRRALVRTYERFQAFLREQVEHHRELRASRGPRTRRGGGKSAAASTPALADPELSAWALVGLGTVASIALELRMLGPADRQRLMAQVGGLLLDGGAPSS